MLLASSSQENRVMGRRKKKMEKEQEKLPLGTIYQAKEGGNYYLRYQIEGKRKNVNLKTDDYDKALEEYRRLLPTRLFGQLASLHAC